MRVRTMGIAAVAASVALVVGAAVAMAGRTNADARLSGYEEVPATSTSGHGRFSAESAAVGCVTRFATTIPRAVTCSSLTSTSDDPPRTVTSSRSCVAVATSPRARRRARCTA